MTFNRNERIALLVLCGALLLGSGVSLYDYLWPAHIEDFQVHHGAVPVPETNEETTTVDPAVDTTHIDINTASIKELQRLPRVGPANGPFRAVDDLTSVRGIGPKSLTRLKPLLTVSPP